MGECVDRVSDTTYGGWYDIWLQSLENGRNILAAAGRQNGSYAEIEPDFCGYNMQW
jgi:hypothetical protein